MTISRTSRARKRSSASALTAGEHWVAATIPRLYEGLPASYNGPDPSTRPRPPPPEFKPRPERTPEEIDEAAPALREEHTESAPANEARVSYIEIGGPYEPDDGPSAREPQRIFVCGAPTRPPRARLRDADPHQPGAARLPPAGDAGGGRRSPRW